MKIGLVVDDTLDKADGVQQYVLSLGRWFAQQGHEVHYIAGHTTRSDVPNVHSVARNVPVRFNGNRLSVPLPTGRRALRTLLTQLQLDVLHVQMPHSPFMAARLVALAPKTTKIVGTFHILPFTRHEALATRLLGIWLRKNLRLFSDIAAVSTAAHDFAKHSFGIETRVLPNVIDVAAFRAGATSQPGNEPHTIVFLGRLVERKGALELLQAVAALPSVVRSGVRVRIGGKGPLLGQLQAYTSKHGIADIVRFDGFIAEADKSAYLSQATLAVFPSISGESFGIVLIEAMAAGAGVVMGGDNPGYRTVLGQWPESLIAPKDTASFAARIATLLADADLRQRLHAEQQQAVQQYDVNVVGAEWLKLYGA